MEQQSSSEPGKPKPPPELRLAKGGRFIVMAHVRELGHVAHTTDDLPLLLDGHEVARVKVVDRMPGTRPTSIGVVFEVESVTPSTEVGRLGVRLDGAATEATEHDAEDPVPYAELVDAVFDELAGRAGFAQVLDATDSEAREDIRIALGTRFGRSIASAPLEPSR